MFNDATCGGVESVILNYFETLDSNKFQVDFIIDKDSTVVPKNEIVKHNGKIYEVSPYQDLINYDKDLKKLFLKNNYDIVHSNINTLSVFPLRIAKRCHIPVRIAHNHSTASPNEFRKTLIKTILKPFSTKYATHFIAPTIYAGRWLFGDIVKTDRFLLLRNAINVNRFKFSSQKRKAVRKLLQLDDDEFVVGSVGRFVWQKNPMYTINVFYEITRKFSKTKLIFLGEGPLKAEVVEYSKEKGIFNKVIFLKNVENIEDYYQAMDVLVFPSHYEGFGNVALEAQCSGLPVFASENVPNDVNVTEIFNRLSLKLGPTNWSDEILKLKNKRNSSRVNFFKKIENTKYDLNTTASELGRFYISSLSK